MVSPLEEAELRYMLLSANLVSALSCIFIILAYKLLKLKMFSFRLVVYISTSDLIHSIALMLPQKPNMLCIIQAMLVEYSSLSEILWTSIMAYSIYQAVINQDPNVEGKEKKFLLIGYGIPILFAFLPLSTYSYGYGLGWCWITHKKYDYLWTIFSFYIFLVVVLMFNTISYVIVHRKVTADMKASTLPEADLKINYDLLLRLKFYPLILLVCYTPVAVRRTYELLFPSSESFWLVWISGFSISITGFLNLVVYGLSKDVKQRVLSSCRRESFATTCNASNIDQSSLNSTFN